MLPSWRILTSPVSRLCLWCLLLCCLLTVSILQLDRERPLLSTDLTALLPVTEQDRGAAEAAKQVTQRIANQVIFRISSSSKSVARSAATRFAELLKQDTLFASLTSHIDTAAWQHTAQFYYPYRYGLLSPDEQNLSQSALSDVLLSRAIQQLTSPIGFGSTKTLIEDPFLQTTHWLSALAKNSGKLQADDGLLTVEKGGQYHVILSGELYSGAMSLSQQEKRVNAIESAIDTVRQAYPGSHILSSGMIFHTKAGADAAKGEVSTIGIGSLLGVILLIVVTFRKVTALLVCLLSIGTGVLAGFMTTLLVFDQVHIMTLVFGASLTGVSIDYAFHYMTERLHQGKRWSPMQGLRHILPGITLGLITSLMGYLPMMTTPFPGLQQIAVFSCAGLIAAWVTVVFAYPYLLRNRSVLPQHPPIVLLLADKLLERWRAVLPRTQTAVLLLFTVIALAGLTKLTTNDDIRQLQARSPALVAADTAIQQTTGAHVDNRFFLVRGETAEIMLQRSEQLSQYLEHAIQQGKLAGFQSISDVLPSIATQKENHQKVGLIFSEALPEFWQKTGISEQAQQQAQLDFTKSQQHYLTPTQWLQSPLAGIYKQLWLGEHDSQYFSAVILLSTAKQWQPESLNTLTGVELIDKTNSTSALFGRYRVLMSWLLVLAYGLIAGMLACRYGLKGAITVIIPPALSVLFTLSLLAFAGQSINLFHILALIMVLGIGIDYTLFFYESDGEYRFTLMAITLSAITTLLSFGLLAFSDTAAIRGFGLTVLLGILFCYLLSPLVIQRKVNAPE